MDMNTSEDNDSKIARVKAASERAAELTAGTEVRRDRSLEDIFHDDVPTFMEMPLVRKPEQLLGADAAVIGFGFEGRTAKSPSVSAPAAVSRPPANSVYWRMGADDAPASIRRYSLYYSRHHNRGWFPEVDPDLTMDDQITVVDYGDVAIDPSDTEISIGNATAKVADVVRAGALPILLGGDHTTPIPAIRGILGAGERKRIGVISFDSHADLCDTDECWASVQWRKSMELDGFSPRNLAEIGIRSVRTTLYERAVADLLDIKIFTIDQVKGRGIADVVAEAIAVASDGTDGIYVSLDIDVMEPSAVPGQKAPEIWGLTMDEMMIALRALSRERLVGFDVCELGPEYDVNGMGAQFCARAVVEILLGRAWRKRAGLT
jgi:arginase family enzyme